MTLTEAAAEVLRLVGRPLHYKEITDLAIEKNLLSHVGKSPEVTMGARLAALLKKTSKDNPLVRVKPGVFALREWDDETIKTAMSDKSARIAADAGSASTSEVADEKAPADRVSASAAPDGDDLADWEEDTALRTPDELRRAEIAAAGAEVFGEEDDDDRPILGGDDSIPPGPPTAEGAQ